MKIKEAVTATNKKEVDKIIWLISEFDHSRNVDAERALEYIQQEGGFKTAIGISYMNRVENIISDNEDICQCIICQERIAKNRVVCSKCMDKLKKFTINPVDHLVDTIDDLLDGDGYVKLRWKDLFSDIKKKHTTEEAEEIFICGTEATTPEKINMSGNWPKPWLYARVFLAMFIAFLFLGIAVGIFGNANAVPGFLFIGSMMVPFTVLIMFFEINAPRNISVFHVVKIFFVGGCASIVVSLLLYEFVPGLQTDEISMAAAFAIAIVEEVAKLVTAAYYINKMKKEKYLLNGLLIGAAVGSGFAVFESAGYALSGMIPSLEQVNAKGAIVFNMGEAFTTMLFRAVFAPGNHIVWTALAGFAAVKMMGDKKFSIFTFLKPKFIAIFFIPVLLHALWDVTWPVLNLTKCLVLIIVAWIILLVFIDNGLDEVNITTLNERKKKRKLE